MNRYDITKRMIGLLHQDEAVIGGIGYTNFDLWAASDVSFRPSATELLHARQHGVGRADRTWRRDSSATSESVCAGG